MIAVVQRVKRAGVRFRAAAEEPWREAGRIGAGLLVLLGVERGDGETAAAWMARKLAKLRIFPDEQGRMNRDVAEHGGAILLVSQFTVCGECARGNRPSFIDAASPEEAEPIVDRVRQLLAEEHRLPVECGRFRTEMEVELVNDGPVTLVVRAPAAATSCT